MGNIEYKNVAIKELFWIFCLVFNSFFPECCNFVLSENIAFNRYKMGTWGNWNGIQHSISLGLKKIVKQSLKRNKITSKQDNF